MLNSMDCKQQAIMWWVAFFFRHPVEPVLLHYIWLCACVPESQKAFGSSNQSQPINAIDDNPITIYYEYLQKSQNKNPWWALQLPDRYVTPTQVQLDSSSKISPFSAPTYITDTFQK